MIAAAIVFFSMVAGPAAAGDIRPSVPAAPAIPSTPTAPAVEFVDSAGLTRALEAAQGKVIVLNFWATWCDPCREEFPDLVRLAAEEPRRIALIAVSLDDPDDIESRVRPFLRAMNFKGRALVKGPGDPDPFITGVDPKWSGGLPATFIHAADGQRVHAVYGAVTYQMLKETLAPLLTSAR